MIVTGFKQIIKNKIGPFASGLIKHNDQFFYTKFKNDIIYETNCYVQFNIYNPYLTYNHQIKKEAYKYILESTKPFLVCEEGAFRQLPRYKRFGWTSYKNGIANFNNNNVDDTRWKHLCKTTGLNITSWSSKGDNILIMGQLELDSALIELYDAGYNSFIDFILEQIYTIRKYTDRPIVVRPHPKSINSFFLPITKFKDVSISRNFSNDSPGLLNGGMGLQQDLNSAYCVVTYNSNSAIEAACQGIPIFTLSPTASAYEIGHTDLSLIENLDYNKDISTWCNKIAYTIWNEDEIKDGTMWGHLKGAI